MRVRPVLSSVLEGLGAYVSRLVPVLQASSWRQWVRSSREPWYEVRITGSVRLSHSVTSTLQLQASNATQTPDSCMLPACTPPPLVRTFGLEASQPCCLARVRSSCM